MTETRAPTMSRSRSQLATVYAPHSLFTFEGGSGACMALPLPNRTYEPSTASTKRMIHEQIVEFLESWLARATSGRDTVIPVSAKRALDRKALRDGSIHLPIGNLDFQVPERVGYIPFPAAFVCTRCGLHQHCKDESRIAQEATRFRVACPSGSVNCADDWQQLDVVLTHWSGTVEALTPMHRYVDRKTLQIRTISSCATCYGKRFFLLRDGSSFSRWSFKCVECGELRDLRRQDRVTLEALKQDLVDGTNVLPQINMEPVSYRASATFYSQGDRLLVFGDDRWISLLQADNVAPLSLFLVSSYGFPSPTLDDAKKERLLRAAGLGQDWTNHVALRDLISTMKGSVDPAALTKMNEKLADDEAQWAKTVFVAHAPAPESLAAVVRARQRFIRRFDPVRMATEHKTLLEESLRSGSALPDGKRVSVDVTKPDEFMVPDSTLDPTVLRQLGDQVASRLWMLGIAEMRLLRALRVCEYTFGYTRTSSNPLVMRARAASAEMPVRLRLFDRVRAGDILKHPVLCLEQSNEAFYVRLDENAVSEWLMRNHLAKKVGGRVPLSLGGHLIEEYAASPFSRFLDEYRRERVVPRACYPFVYTLLHTMSHHLIGVSASMSGLDLGSFGEHLFVPDLAFLIYRRGMTMDLGNLSSMWRDRGDRAFGNEILDRMVSPESLRCGSESVCAHNGGACPDCILIPEIACLTRNELLSRSVLCGRGSPRWDADTRPLVGFYEVSSSRNGTDS